MTAMVGDVRRYVRGRLNGVHAEPGTLLGPNDLGELMIVIAADAGGVTVGFAQPGDVEAALAAPEPRSPTEAALRRAESAGA